jgi:hypothetical protein
MINRHGSDRIIFTQLCQLNPEMCRHIGCTKRLKLLELIFSESDGCAHRISRAAAISSVSPASRFPVMAIAWNAYLLSSQRSL